MSGIKIDVRDTLFSKLVRERAGWKCERCGQQFRPPEKDGDNSHLSGLHCAHICLGGRRQNSTRFWPWGSISACYGCHSFIDANRMEKEIVARRIFGAARYEETCQRHKLIVRFRGDDSKILRQNLKREYEAMMAKRKAGMRGRIEFESPYER